MRRLFLIMVMLFITSTLFIACNKKEGGKKNSTNNQFFKDELFSDSQKGLEQIFTGNVWV